jgi:beta-lactamase class D
MLRTPGAFLLVLLFSLAGGCKSGPTYTTRDDFKKFYDESHVKGSFVLFDLRKDRYVFYNREQLHDPFTPASTFKILNSLIGLETGVIKDADFVIPWDSVPRPATAWNRDYTLRSAFQNSVVPYYQELARRVGGERMKRWLEKAQYGNADTSGGIDRFWLDGGLRITPAQQIDFLKRLYSEELPFSKRSMDIVKEIMVVRDTVDWKLRAKTGRSERSGMQIGWYIGYLERKGDVYFFSNCIQSDATSIPDFIRARVDITYKILGDLRLLPE